VLAEFDEKERTTRVRQLNGWAEQFAGLALAEFTADRISQARDRLGAETFTRGKSRKDKKTGEVIPPKAHKRSGGTVNRYIACLSHALSFAVKEPRLLERNPVSDISRKKELRGRGGSSPMRSGRRYSRPAGNPTGRRCIPWFSSRSRPAPGRAS
jgi:hypothetical protein